MNKKTLKTVAVGVTVGIGVGVVATVAYYTSSHVHIFKEAKWTPQGDMLLTFYHKTNGILCHKPE